MKSSAKVALVTGGARGIGLGISRELAQAGFDLAICGVRPAECVAAAVESLQQGGRQVLYCQTDISCAEDRRRLIDAVRDHFGRLNVLVNNAGVAPRERRDILDATEESFDEVLRINLRGPYFLTQQAARWMIEQKEEDDSFGASIIFISSISATVASVNRGEYCLSKAGIAMASRLWAVRLGASGIPVYEVRPGIVLTDMTSAVQDKYDRLIREGLLLESRWGLPEDVGRCVRALAVGDLPYATGQVIVLDGGMTIARL